MINLRKLGTDVASRIPSRGRITVRAAIHQ
jgi:hypothetical protein